MHETIDKQLAKIRRKYNKRRATEEHEDGGKGSGIKGHKTYHNKPASKSRVVQRNATSFSRQAALNQTTGPGVKATSGQQESSNAVHSTSTVGVNTQNGQAVAKNAKYNVGNIDLTKRPKVPAEKMIAAGYDVEPGSVSTVYSSYDFFWQGDEENGKYVCVHYTPIMEDGTVLTAEEVGNYIAGSGEGGNILDNDKNGKHLVMNVEEIPGDISPADMEQFMKSGQSTPAIDSFMKKADQWDEDVHNAQAELYTT